MSTTAPAIALLFMTGLVAAQPGSGVGTRDGAGRDARTTADVNDATIQGMANTAVLKLGSEYSLTRVNSASTQVVAGTLYHLTLQLSKSSSSAASVNNFVCRVTVHEKPWVSYLEMTEMCCNLLG